MIGKKLYITGGIGARHEGESFGDNYELPDLTAYCETCAAIGSVYWNHRMFLLTGEAKYFDVLERTLYNGLIAGISTEGTTFFYPNPLESDGKFAFNHGSCTRQSWFDCSCCPTNLIRFIPAIPGLIYAQDQDTVFVNLYASNSATFGIRNTDVRISQLTNYPWEGKILVKIEPETAKNFTLKFRIPYWARNVAVPGDLYAYTDDEHDSVKITVNGVTIKTRLDQEYIEITRKWERGDSVLMIFPMEIKRTITNWNVQPNHNKVALEYGPLVYCAEETDNGNHLSEIILPDTSVYNIVFRKDLFGGINTIVGEAHYGITHHKKECIEETGLSAILIPYYLWSNRGIGKMKVWFPRE